MAWTGPLDLADDGLQDLVEVPRQCDLAEVHEPNDAIDLVGVEERELLLVTEHLEQRLAQHAEMDSRGVPPWRGRTWSGAPRWSCRCPGPRR